MNDEQLGPVVSSWLKEENRPPSDPTASVRTVMNAATKTRQLRRRWWLPPFVHRMPDPPSQPHAVDHTTAYQPSPIPATNGHTPTVLGRTQSMFSPAKAITAGAIVFAIGGVMLIAQPFERQASVPGATTDMAPATFTMQNADEPKVTTLNTGATIVVGPVESSDQRASGTLTQVAAGTRFDVADGDAGRISSDAVRLVNDGGSWVGSSRGFLTFPSDGPETVQFLGELVGEGGYDGLTLFYAQTGDTEDVRWLGVIVPTVDIPAVPDLPAE